MSDDVSSTLFPALEIAAFARGPDGAFASISPVPAWFARLVDDATFPFLGHILEDANQFWNGGSAGFQEFGPCAEVDEAGNEFHYKVVAVSTPEKQFLLFLRDPGTDRMREVLQKAREQALRAGDDARARAVIGILTSDARTAARELRGLTARLRRGRLSAEEIAIVDEIDARCDRLDRLADVAASGTPSAD